MKFLKDSLNSTAHFKDLELLNQYASTFQICQQFLTFWSKSFAYMFENSMVTLILIAVTIFVSYKGFNRESFKERFVLSTDKVLIQKDYFLLISSGFLHSGWWHLLGNMLVLYSFGTMLEPMVGSGQFALIYFISLIGSGLLELLIHKMHGDYKSLGASGAVCGVVFASIALFPNMGIGFFFIPASIPSWAYGLAYVLFTIYGVKSQWGNSGHAAHLGGALIGMLVALLLYPASFQMNYLPILAIVIPTISFILLIIYKPHVLLIDSSNKRKRYYSIDHEYNHKKVQEQMDIDSILDKIHRKGIKSLSKQEREILEQYSKTV